MELIFSTGHYSSRVQKSASIICNAPGMTPALNISAFPISHPESLKVFTFEPFQLDLDSTRPEQQKKAWEYDFTVKNISDAQFGLKLVSGAGDFMKIDVPDGEIKPGKEKTIKIKVSHDIADTIFTKSFTVEASDTAHTRFTFPVHKGMRWGPAPTSSR